MTQDEVEVEVGRIMEAQWKWAVDVETKKEALIRVDEGTRGPCKVEKARSLIWEGNARCPMLGVAWQRNLPHSRGGIALSLAALFWGVIQRVGNNPGPYRTQSALFFFSSFSPLLSSPSPHLHAAMLRRNFSPFPCEEKGLS